MNGRVLENLRDTYIVSPSYATLYSTRRNTQPKEIFVSLCKLQIPTKVGFFVWRNFWNRLPTKDMLRDKNVQLNNENNLCPFCYKVEESPSKKKKRRVVLFTCEKVVLLRNEFYQHCFGVCGKNKEKSMIVWCALI